MAKADSLAQLLEGGDALEKCMFADDEFASAFHNYPGLWADFVLHNRDPDVPMRAKPEWEPLAEHHYSAIVRCWNVYSARRALLKLCDDFKMDAKASTILSMHSEAVAFFCCAGGAIENIKECFCVEQLGCPDAFEKKAATQKAKWSLRRIFELRSKYVHKIIVPCFSSDRKLSLDASLLGDPDLRWKDSKGQSPTEVSEIVESVWSDFSRNMNDIWATLYSKLMDLRVLVPKPGHLVDVSEREGEPAVSGMQGDPSNKNTSGTQTLDQVPIKTEPEIEK